MKKKLIASLLCLAMILAIVTPAAFANEEEGVKASVEVYCEGAPVEEGIAISENDREGLTVTAKITGAGEGKLQWQIYVDGVWANILGETDDSLKVRYALVANALNDGVAELRARFTPAEGDVLYAEFKVGISEPIMLLPLAGEEIVPTPAPKVVDPGSVVVHDSAKKSEAPKAEEPSAPDAPVEEQPEGGATGDDDSTAVDGADSDPGAMPLSETGDEDADVPSVQAEGDVKKTYNIVINYVFENKEIVSDPYTATLAEDSSFSATVTFPTVQGYLPYVGETQQDGIALNYASVSGDVTINVVYKPTNVKYTVIHYQQNVDNDQYTVKETETKQGLTASQVPEVAKTYEGFYNLIYERPPIAADGSTVIEIYYDRYYYLMNFDMDGGYGTEPVYARYGANIGEVKEPTKAGYDFKGWTLDGNSAEIPATMPAENRTYKAVWEVGDAVNYVVVYWKENADDSNYSYWGQQQKSAKAGTRVSGSDDIPQSVHNGEKQYFTYNAGKTDANVEVKGDGSTVINVYYFRNTYTIYFRGLSGTCAIEEHTHGTTCAKTLNCTLPVHESHTDACLICTKVEHEHSSACCSLEEHAHSVLCYDGATTTEASASWGTGSQPDGYVAQKLSWNSGEKVIRYNGKWYEYNGDVAVGQTATMTCGKTAHKHGTDCNCSQEAHSHSEQNGCYVDQIHVHDDGCYRSCTKLEHTHTDQCSRNSTQNVIYVVTAKYEQNIANVWPTADKFPDSNLRGWTIEGISGSEAVSKRVNMTADLCDTSDGLKYASANTGGSKKYLYYMFESFDQTSAANGNERILRNGIYYDKSETYYQEVNSSGSWNQKQIYGMTPVNNGVVTSGDNIFLYYTRNRSALSFYNVNDTVKTVNNIMFEQPLKDYKDSDDKLLREFTPGYPSSLEPNAYEFAGWYTSPDCFDGTEFNFNTATMPNGDLTLYAKWTPVKHTVKFYLTPESKEVYTPTNAAAADFVVAHADYVDGEYVAAHLTYDAMNEAKPNGSYKFVVWYYFDKDGKTKYYDPTMQVRENLVLYGAWSSDVLKAYTVQYVLKADHSVKVADDLTGSGLAGTTKTFDAKGGAELYEAYQEGYFPTVQSQSLLLDIDEETLTITFEYVPMPAVPYTVKYVEKDTGKSLDDDKVVSDNRKAVVTETFKPITGYMPDAYQKRLVVTADGENTLYFYYSKDDTHAYYKITHFIQNTDGATWTEYAASQAVGDIGTRYTASSMTIPGYTYDHIKYVVDGTEVTDVTAEGAQLTANGLEINLYYVRNEYPYQVRYLEQGTGNVLHDPKNGTGLYGEVISESAIAIDGYEAVAPTSATLNIRIDEGEGAPNLNIITFYYKKDATINYVVVGDGGKVDPAQETVHVFTGVAQGSTATADDGYRFDGWYSDAACTNKVGNAAKYVPTKPGDEWVNATYYAKFVENEVTINYVAVGPTGAMNFGSVNPESETVKVKSGTAQGSTATAGDGFKFVGWYKDAACTQPVDASWVAANKLTPQKTDGKNVEATYYAKFEYDITSLTIEKKINGTQYDAKERFVFVVKGEGLPTDGLTVTVEAGKSVTINGLKVGATYTVTEKSDWSWRYEASDTNASITLTAKADDNVVTITNTPKNDKWLNFNDYVRNFFKKIEEAGNE